MKNFLFIFLFLLFAFSCSKNDAVELSNNWIKTTEFKPNNCSRITSLRDTIVILINNNINNGGFQTSRNGVKWNTLNAIDNSSYNSIISYQNNLYISNQLAIYCSNDMGRTWEQKNNGLPSTPFITRVVETDGGLFACGNGLYRSLDNGENWTAVNIPGLVQSASIVYIKNALIASITTSSISGLYKSIDNGANWTQIRSLPESVYVNQLYVADDVLFATSSANISSIWVSYDKGTTWLEGKGLSSKGPNTISSFEFYNGITYAATMNGVFKSIDYGKNWTYMGLENAISLLRKNNKLYAGTINQGLWSIDIYRDK